MQSFRVTYGWLGINITSRLLVFLGKKFEHLIGTAKQSATFCTTMARGMGMRRLVDGYEPTDVAGSAEWLLHDSCPYDEHENSSPISACRVGIRTTAQGERSLVGDSRRRERRNGISYLDQ